MLLRHIQSRFNIITAIFVQATMNGLRENEAHLRNAKAYESNYMTLGQHLQRDPLRPSLDRNERALPTKSPFEDVESTAAAALLQKVQGANCGFRTKLCEHSFLQNPSCAARKPFTYKVTSPPPQLQAEHPRRPEANKRGSLTPQP